MNSLHRRLDMAGRKSRHHTTDEMIRKTLERGYRGISFNREEAVRDRIREIINGKEPLVADKRQDTGSEKFFTKRKEASANLFSGRMFTILGTAAAAAFLVATLYVTTFLSAPQRPYITIAENSELVLSGEVPFAAVHYAVHEPVGLNTDTGRAGQQ